MKAKKFLITHFSLTLGFISFANAASNFQFQNIRTGGLGCPSDITQIVMAPDLSSASLLFQRFESHVPVLETGPKINPLISTLNCNIFLDIALPEGQKIDSLEISYDMRGHAFLGAGVEGYFKSFLVSKNGLGSERSSGIQTLQEKKWFNTNYDQDEDFYVQVVRNIPIKSNCRGEDRNEKNDRVSLHIQHQLGSQILGGYQNSNTSGTITMDSSDLKGGIKFKAYTSSCNSRGGPRREPNERPNPGPREGKTCRMMSAGGRQPVLVCY